MKLEKISLKNFRNIDEIVFVPEPGLNFLEGDNGQGKTSLLEAIDFLASLRSFRESHLHKMIQWGKTQSSLSCILSESRQEMEWTSKLHIQLQMTNPPQVTKTVFANEKHFRTSTQYLSQRFGPLQSAFHTVVFHPADHDLVRGEPHIRRIFLDRALSSQSDQYLKNLKDYQRILHQKNCLLKTMQMSSQRVSEVLESFNNALCHKAVELTLERLKWLQQLEEILKDSLKKIAPELTEVNLKFLSTWINGLKNKTQRDPFLDLHSLSQKSEEELKEIFLNQTLEHQAAELQAGYALIGPHRDDWSFFLDHQILKGHGSQGEVRAILVALKLSEMKVFQSGTGSQPLFLLDDFSSELDQKRRSFLMDFLIQMKVQTFVTTTQDTPFLGQRYWVSQGTITTKKG